MVNAINRLSLLCIGFFSCSSSVESGNKSPGTAHNDQAFIQEYSIKYYPEEEVELEQVIVDRNGTIQVLSNKGLYRSHSGNFLYPGRLIPDRFYLSMAALMISKNTVKNQLAKANVLSGWRWKD